MIIREQDRAEVIKRLAYMLARLSTLYQIPNFGSTNAVFLAEWILDNYGWEELWTIEAVLKNPPRDDEKNWRLTPDTITKWMSKKLEQVAESREAELAKYKESHKDALPEIDYEAFKKRLAETGIPKDPPKGWHEPAYQEEKAKYIQKRILSQGTSQFTEDMLTPKEPASVTEPLEAKSRRA